MAGANSKGNVNSNSKPSPETNTSEDSVQKISVADLVGAVIKTADGKQLGHVVDLKVTKQPPHRVLEIVFGRYAWLYRFDVFVPFAKLFGIEPAPHLVTWEAVDRFEKLTLYLKEGRDRDIKKHQKL